MNGNRGGTCVFIHQYLNKYVFDVDVSIADQVWFKLKCIPGVLFGSCYVPPSDSIYFSYAQLSSIQEKIKTNACSNGCILIGDLNARLGVSVRELPDRVAVSHFSYPVVPDPIQTPNDNATALLGICAEEQMLVINNMQTPDMHFTSKKTFRKGREWTSELDTCFVSKRLVKFIKYFDVIHDESLPSDHAPITITLQPPSPCLETLRSRACDLGKHGAECNFKIIPNNPLVKRPLQLHNVDCDMFVSKLNEQDTQININANVDLDASQLSNTLYDLAYTSRTRGTIADGVVGAEQGRWDRILGEDDQSKLWQAINWRGEITDVHSVEESKPTDEIFKYHFEGIFNPPNADNPDPSELHTNVTIPVLDELIKPDEIISQIRKLKPNKASGPDGLPPGLFKLLPAEWIIFITALFNNLFLSGSYPDCWTSAKLFTVFKRGSKVVPGNYRGINVINSLAKLYDMILSARLSQWFIPYREQAGSQVGRGCIEHIVTLRLLMDVARRKKLKLFITFVDFSKA
ncbi:unnamed protein product, partial [Meganyctiphanes norvegica]